MARTVEIGASGAVSHEVGDSDTAIALGSGDVAVLATPRLVAWLEAAAVEALRPYLEQGETSVGVSVSVEHRAGSSVGADVVCSANVTAVDRRAVDFELQAVDSGEVVMVGEHRRMVVDKARFEQSVGAGPD